VSAGLPNNALVQRLDLLLSGTGFNYYKSENRARADDLLIREQAAGALSSALAHLSGLHTEYRLRYIPPPSREAPFPPQEEVRRAQDILALRDRIGALESTIRGMSAPTEDKIWKRFRQELDLLNRLLSADSLLIMECENVRERVTSLTPDLWRARSGRRLRICCTSSTP
jgi:hypothetical protein